MRVSSASDHVTHAIVGGGEAEAFEIDQSAEFFQILSSTLYSDKMLAVVREVMCNAWDAHIDSGRTDKAIKVTLNSSKLIIQDFGYGIPRALMAQRYAKYGGSTKAKDEKQTGGFGLGCKAPFAYTDNFEVTSCHQHEKTIFRLALSAAVVGGKPSILPIMTIPTTESGLTVSIDLKTGGDFHRFDTLVRNIAALGEMKVELNGNKLHVIPFSEAKHDFLFVSRKFTKDDQLISVRCGNVVYPLTESDEYRDAYYKARQLIQNISGRNYYSREGQTWTLVLLAPPGGVSPTPSRESLSLTPTTLKTVKKLLKDFVENFDDNTPHSEFLDILKERIAALFLKQKQYQLYAPTAYHPVAQLRQEIQELGYLNTRRQLSLARLSQEMPTSRDFLRRELYQRIDLLIKAGVPEKKLLIGFRKALVKDHAQCNKGRKARSYRWRSPWLHKTVIHPVLEALKENGLSQDNFMYFLGDQYRQSDSFRVARTCSAGSLIDVFPYLKRFVVLAHNRTHIIERAPQFPEWKKVFDRVDGINISARCFCYVVPRSKGKPELAKKVLEDLGFEVLDLTEVRDWEDDIYQPSTTPAVKRIPIPKKKGIPLLSSIEFDLNTREFEFSQPFQEIPNDKRTMTPEVVVNVGRTNRETFGQLGVTDSYNIYKLFGDKIGLVNNTTALVKAEKSGVKMFSDWLRETVAHEMINNPEIKLAHTSDPDNAQSSYEYDQFVDAIRDDPELCKVYKLAPQPSERARIFLELWKSFGAYETQRNTILKPADDLIKTWSMSAEYLALEKLFDSSKLISLINPLGFKSIMRSGTPAQKTAAREMIIAALKG